MLNQVLILVGSVFPFLSTLSTVKPSNVCNIVNSNIIVQYLVEHGFGQLLCQDSRVNLVIHAGNSLMLYYLLKNALYGQGVDQFITQRSALVASLYFAVHPSRNWNFVSSVSTINYVSVFILLVGVTVRLRPNSPILNVFGVLLIILGAVIYPEPVLLCIILALVTALNFRLHAYSSKGYRDFAFFALCGGLLLAGGVLCSHDMLNETLLTTRSTQFLVLVVSTLSEVLHLLVNIAQIIKAQFSLLSALTVR